MHFQARASFIPITFFDWRIAPQITNKPHNGAFLQFLVHCIIHTAQAQCLLLNTIFICLWCCDPNPVSVNKCYPNTFIGRAFNFYRFSSIPLALSRFRSCAPTLSSYLLYTLPHFFRNKFGFLRAHNHHPTPYTGATNSV